METSDGVCGILRIDVPFGCARSQFSARLYLHGVALLCGRFDQQRLRTVKGNSFRMGHLQFYNSCSQEAEVHVQ